jgi:hypothetical protein
MSPGALTTGQVGSAEKRTTVGALTVESGAGINGPRNPIGAPRLPEEHDLAPGAGRMVVTSAWAAVLVLLGMVVGVRTFIAIALDPGPRWLIPTVMILGIAGTACTGIALATIRRPRLPWRLLGLATLLLCGNLCLVITLL